MRLQRQEYRFILFILHEFFYTLNNITKYFEIINRKKNIIMEILVYNSFCSHHFHINTNKSLTLYSNTYYIRLC